MNQTDSAALQNDKPRRRGRTQGVTRQRDRVREVYFIRASNGLIKIGVSNNTARRIVTLRSASADSLELVGMMICPHYGALEKWLHARFRAHRVTSEWFTAAPDLMTFIADNAVDEDRAMVAKVKEQSRRGAPGKGLPWVMA